jgi:hypothetical protein
MNPSGQPFPNQFGGGPGGGQMPPPNDPAREALNVPSLLFMVFGGISVLYAIFALLSSVLQGDTSAQLQPLLDNPDLPPAAKKLVATMVGPGAKMINLLSMGLAAFIAFAGFQMRSLKSYGVAVAGSIVMMLPCGSCCCIITMPIGIWALVTLMKPEIKNAFT